MSWRTNPRVEAELVSLPVIRVAHIALAGEQRVDQPGSPVCTGVGEEARAFLEARDATGDIQIEAAQENLVAGGRVQLGALRRVVAVDQGIHIAGDYRHRRASCRRAGLTERCLAMLKLHPSVQLGPVGDPRAEQCPLALGERLRAPFQRGHHIFIGVRERHALQQFALVGLAG
jgi:hypothetical protein